MERNHKAITLFDNVTPVAVTSSTDATPIVVTATAHGFTTGQRVLIYGHTTNVAANGIYKVTVLTSSTFSLQNEITGASIAGSGAGAGSSGVCLIAPPIVQIKDFTNVILQLGTSGTATTTIKAAGSLGKTSVSANGSASSSLEPGMPNFGATVNSRTNPYSFIQLVDLDTAATVNGSTGVVVAGTDIMKLYEVNMNALTFFTLIPISWTAGAINAVLLVTSI